MVQIYNWLAYTFFALVDSCALFASAIWQPVQTKEISVLGLHDMFFGFVAKQGADISEIRRLGNVRREFILVLAVFLFLGFEKCVEYRLRAVVKESNHRVSCILLARIPVPRKAHQQ